MADTPADPIDVVLKVELDALIAVEAASRAYKEALMAAIAHLPSRPGYAPAAQRIVNNIVINLDHPLRNELPQAISALNPPQPEPSTYAPGVVPPSA